MLVAVCMSVTLPFKGNVRSEEESFEQPYPRSTVLCKVKKSKSGLDFATVAISVSICPFFFQDVHSNLVYSATSRDCSWALVLLFCRYPPG